MFLWFLVILFSFLQATWLHVDVVTGLVLWILLTWPAKRALVTVWGWGWIINLVSGQAWGWLSLTYLGFGLGLWWYRRKYFPFHILVLGLFMGGSELLVGRLVTGEWHWIQAAVLGILGWLLRGRIVDNQLAEGGLRLEYK